MNVGLNWNERKIKVPKLGLVKFRHSGNKKGKFDFFLRGEVELKSITIRKNPANEYYAVLLFEREYCHKKKFYEGGENQAIGLDFSPADFYINSDGSSGKDFGYIAQKQANLKKLTKLQRNLMRKQIGSANREKARVKVARMEHYIAECRNAKNYGDASWRNFTNKLLWKSSLNENNCQVVKADRFFASSQICHCCGFKNPITKNLAVRSWICPNCGSEHIRDVNAAINLKMNAIKNVGQGVSEFRSVEGVEKADWLCVINNVQKNAEKMICPIFPSMKKF